MSPRTGDNGVRGAGAARQSPLPGPLRSGRRSPLSSLAQPTKAAIFLWIPGTGSWRTQNPGSGQSLLPVPLSRQNVSAWRPNFGVSCVTNPGRHSVTERCGTPQTGLCMSDTGASRVVLITRFRLTTHALHACNFIRGTFGWGGQTTIDRT